MLPMPPILGYILFFILASLGSIIGVFTGWLIRRRKKLRPKMAVVDGLSGAAGFVLGVYLSLLNFSLEERFVDDRLVYRKVTGFADYLWVFGIVGAVFLPLVAHACISLVSKLRPDEA
jgi:hypothetical protein